MADLDDFFAKKDRKKSKSVKKFATADELAKKLDDPKQKSDARPKKERPAQEGDESRRAGEEEEWKEYEEPVKDYTGLKIQVLQGGANAQAEGRDQVEDCVSDGGKFKGPWNKVEAEKPAAEEPASPKPAAAPSHSKPATYVAPSRLRAPEPLRRTQPKNAPDIHNDDYFPVLGAPSAAAKRQGQTWSAPRPQAATLPLGNRFTDLQDDS